LRFANFLKFDLAVFTLRQRTLFVLDNSKEMIEFQVINLERVFAVVNLLNVIAGASIFIIWAVSVEFVLFIQFNAFWICL
jgi:hypothetical protein